MPVMRPATPAPLLPLPVVPGAVSRPHSSEIAYWEESELREQNFFMARLP